MKLRVHYSNLRLVLGLIFATLLALTAIATSVYVVTVEAIPLESGQATEWIVTDTTSLNAAITAANAETSGTHTITLGSDITLSATSTDINLQPGVTLIIEGAGYTLDGAGAYRGLTILGVSTVEIQNLTIANGYDADIGGGILNEGMLTVTNSTFSINGTISNGGGIYNDGTLTVTNSTFSGNSAPFGGGINNGFIGTLTVTNSTFSGNSALFGGGISTSNELSVTNSTFSENIATFGGGIDNMGTLTVTNCTFSGNSADYGGGIDIGGSGTMTVTNSTFSDNFATYGGGIDTGSSGTVTNSTFSGNQASQRGGGIRNNSGTLIVTNSTFSSNTVYFGQYGGGIYNNGTLNLINTILVNSAFGGDCYNDGTTGTDVHNLIEDNTLCGTPVSSADPNLGPLQDNGGPTHTMAIDPTSSAFNAGDTGACPAADQRGVDRPNGAACDIGAYEFQIPAPVDFDFDFTSDVVVFRGGAWRTFDYEAAALDHGVWTGTAAGCIPAPMDYDGDGGVEPTQLCEGAWHFYNDDGSYNKGIWTGGVAGDLPVPADYDGDGTDDVVVWRAGAWRFFDFASGVFDHGVWTGSPPHWLGGTSMPIPMDYDGDGPAEFTVWSGGPWHFYHDDGSYNKGIWTGGVAGDLPAPADYNGDITEEVVVWRSGAWRFFDFATAAFDHGVWTGAPPHWLGGTPLPSPLDYDGNGIVDFTVWSGGPWHFYDITGAYIKGIWTGGVAGDLPISRRLLP